MTLSIPIRIDNDIYISAKAVARTMDRSAAQQVGHWARLGREVEETRSYAYHRVTEVLAGSIHYDDLDDPHLQEIVRAVWVEQTKQWCQDLDLEAQFTSEGVPYAELDEHGEVVVHEPGMPAMN